MTSQCKHKYDVFSETNKVSRSRGKDLVAVIAYQKQEVINITVQKESDLTKSTTRGLKDLIQVMRLMRKTRKIETGTKLHYKKQAYVSHLDFTDMQLQCTPKNIKEM